ncbi:unnamed protein product [Calicophoron daubneyi]|uniref:Uncharacterized protein n=1 Tax=Calicophoron daubneyi TaxID=300641 RepID=A0AAV2TJS4_CALDB
MSTVDKGSLFQVLTDQLSDLIAKHRNLFETREEVCRIFDQYDMSSKNTVEILSQVRQLLRDVQPTYDNFQTVNEEHFLGPLKQIAQLLPSISALSSERNGLLNTLGKYAKKRQKLEGMERTGENLAKLGDYTVKIDKANTRLKTIDILMERDLKELGTRTEVFVGRTLKAHLNWRYQSCLATSCSSADIATAICSHAREQDLSLLEGEMEASLAQIRSSPIVRQI